MRIKSIALASTCVLLTCASSNLHAVISAQITSFNSSTIGFDISGDIPIGANIGTTGSSSLYIGDPGNVDWILVGGTTDTVVNNGSPSNGALAASYLTDGTADYIVINFDDFFAVGDTVDATITITGGFMVPGSVNPSDMIITAGTDSFSAPFPKVANQVGNVVPEPSTYATLAGLSVLGVALAARRKSFR